LQKETDILKVKYYYYLLEERKEKRRKYGKKEKEYLNFLSDATIMLVKLFVLYISTGSLL